MDRDKIYRDYVAHGRIPTTFDGVALLVDAHVVRSTPVPQDVLAAMNDALADKWQDKHKVTVQQYFDRVRIVATTEQGSAAPED